MVSEKAAAPKLLIKSFPAASITASPAAAEVIFPLFAAKVMLFVPPVTSIMMPFAREELTRLEVPATAESLRLLLLTNSKLLTRPANIVMVLFGSFSV